MRKPRQKGEVTLPGTQNSWVVDFGFSSLCAYTRSLNHCAKIRCLLDEHKNHTLTRVPSAASKERAFELSCLHGRRIGASSRGLRKAGEQWEAPSHPRVASFTSETSFCGVKWGRRKKREMPSQIHFFFVWSLGFLESNFPQMPRAFFQCPVSVRCLMSHMNRKCWNWIWGEITGKGWSGRKWVSSWALKCKWNSEKVKAGERALCKEKSKWGRGKENKFLLIKVEGWEHLEYKAGVWVCSGSYNTP